MRVRITITPQRPGRRLVPLSAPSASPASVARLTPCAVTGAIDGNNKIFAISTAPQWLLWFWGGVLQSEPDDYVYANGVVTMTLAPDVGQKLVAIGRIQ